MKVLKVIFSTFILMLLCTTLMVAQSKNKKKPTSAAAKKKARTETKKNEDNFWTTKMWYGGDIALGLGGGTADVTLFPMVGYKITDRFSAGVISKLYYHWERVDPNQFTGVNSFENLNVGGGVFARARIFSGLFAHVEYENTRFNKLIGFDLNTNKFVKEKIVEPYCYAGLGWSGGYGKWKSQIGIYRNILLENTQRGLWDLRLGVNYNF